MKQQYLQNHRQTSQKSDYMLDSKSTTAYEKRLEKCTSATEFSLNHRHRNQRAHDMYQPYFEKQESRNSLNKEKQLGEFMFCLKLKMISIAGIFDGLELTTEVIDKKDAKELLDELARKIKNFQKQSAKKLQELQVKCKSLEIQLINVESQRKSLEYQSTHSRKQIQRSSKTSEIELKKMEAKIKLQQNEKQIVESKLIEKTHLVEQLNKKIAELESKNREMMKTKKDNDTILLQKDKQIMRLESQFKDSKQKKEQEIESLKASLMKKVDDNNKLNAELKQLKQLIDRKDNKINQQRRNYNLLYAEMQKSNCQLSSLHEQVLNLRSKLQTTTKSLESLTSKQSTVNSSLSGLTRSHQDIQGKLQQLNSSYTNLLLVQEKFHREVVQISGYINEEMDKLDQMYKSRECLMREQSEIQIRQKVKEEELRWRDRVQELEQLVMELHCKLDMSPQQLHIQ